MVTKIIIKAATIGVLASLGMTAVYVMLMLWTMSAEAAWLNFVNVWYLISGIIIGFGLQIGLSVYLKNLQCLNHAGTVTAASGAVSGTTMVVCCIHHLAEVLPILGISGATIFLTQYQKPLLLLGLAINLAGLAYISRLLGRQISVSSRAEAALPTKAPEHI
ncbi:hypothetical protein HY933_00580 [Candidatus Falkowbacteria bacterium]|nr:hypothetical protein [Candidatus Falkowbacteria bacterium]